MSYTAPQRAKVGLSLTTRMLWAVGVASTNCLSSASAAAYPTADLAIYMPVVINGPILVRKLAVPISSASGNVDVGLYGIAGDRIVSTGTVAAAAGLVVDVADTLVSGGQYYVAVVADNTTVTIYRATFAAPLCAASGILTEQLGAGAALPATASWSIQQTLAYYPYIGFLFGSVPT